VLASDEEWRSSGGRVFAEQAIDLRPCNHDPPTDAKCSKLAPLHERMGGRPPDAENHGDFRNGVRPPANRSQPMWRRQSGPPASPRVWVGDEVEMTRSIVWPEFHTLVRVTESVVA